jgi:hypothetical protein
MDNRRFTMAEPIYKMYLGKTTEAWHVLSHEEKNKLLAKVQGVLGEAGGKQVLMCNPSWCNEQWHFFGVEEFPNIEAVQKHTKLLAELNWERYVESVSYLGTSY